MGGTSEIVPAIRGRATTPSVGWNPMGQTIWTVGHSTQDLDAFLGLLRDHSVEVVADVRSQPFSRRNPQFNKDNLRTALLELDIQYVFLGLELGGRPPEPEFYDKEGHVLYGAVARTERFDSGLRRLLQGSNNYRVAMLCSEEDPTHCHRRLLVTRVLCERGISVEHIRGDGHIVHEIELGALPQDISQGALFGQEVSSWRSTRSVSPSIPRKTSLRS